MGSPNPSCGALRMYKHIVLAVLLAFATQDALAKESRNSIGAELADDSRAGAQNDFTADVIKTLLAPIDADLDTEFKSSEPRPCPSVCKCHNGSPDNGDINVNADGYCIQTCSKIYDDWHKSDPFARFCGVGSSYAGTGSVDCTGCASANSAWYADTLCLPGGINNRDPYNPTHQRACADLSEEKCVASHDCTFHSSCETSVSLSALRGHQNLFQQFPHLNGQSFTCSCDEALQFHQIQMFLVKLGVSGPTNSCQAKRSHRYLPGVKTWCQKLKTNQACMASSAICEDPHFAKKGAFAEKHVVAFVDALKCC